MSLKLLIDLSGIPGLETGAEILGATYKRIEDIKLYRQQCWDLNSRCVQLLLALHESTQGLEGTTVMKIADELEPIIERIHRKVGEWGQWGQLKSFVQQREIKEGIESLNRALDGAMTKFHIQTNIENNRGHLDLKAIHEQYAIEIRELLSTIVKSQKDMGDLLNMQKSNPVAVEEMMQGLQTQLLEYDLPRSEEKTFKEGLWVLHENTSKLPPLTDLSGQITMSSLFPVVEGSTNDIYRGLWLDREHVALRLPRALASNAEVRDRFEREAAIWRQMDHQNVMPLYGIAWLKDDQYLVSPWMENGTVLDYTKRHHTVDRPKLLTDIAVGLEYLHSKDIIHGDLRGANVLVSSTGDARLSDFGVSSFLEDCNSGLPHSSTTSTRWMAPEVLHKDGIVSTFSDVWSFGMVCLEILTGEVPFTELDDAAVAKKLERGKHPERPNSRMVTSRGLNSEFWELMKRCWSTNPEERPTMTTVKRKLLEFRGLLTPDRKTRMSSLFSPVPKTSRPSRPSTADSDTSLSTLGSTYHPKARFFSTIYSEPESDELFSSISRQTSPSNFDPPSPVDLKRSPNLLHAIQPLSATTGISPTSSSPSRPIPVASTSKTPPRLELAHLAISTSLPSETGSGLSARGTYGHQSSTRSTYSADAVSPFSTDIEEATKSPLRILHLSDGRVSTGTLDGLIDFLISNFHARKHREFRETFFMACSEFTTAETLFDRLHARFNHAESDMMLAPEERVASQYNILMIISEWLGDENLPPSDELLWRMKAFCDDAIRIKSSSTMVDRASELRSKIDTEVLGRRLADSVRQLGGPLLQSVDIRPRDLAIALTLLEGDNYASLTPADYIHHLTTKSSQNLRRAYEINNKIFAWVVDSVLYYDRIEDRAQVLKMFITTAYECQKLRNFSSSIAITTALHSTPVESLKLTRKALPLHMQTKLDELYDITNPDANHRRYREAVDNTPTADERDICIPWVAIHLRDLRKVLNENRVTVQVNNQRLINYRRYFKLAERMKEVIHYKPPRMDQYRRNGALAYVESQLEKIICDQRTQQKLQERSNELVRQEVKAHLKRTQQLVQLGFRI